MHRNNKTVRSWCWC